jgi:hypothetical protein
VLDRHITSQIHLLSIANQQQLAYLKRIDTTTTYIETKVDNYLNIQRQPRFQSLDADTSLFDSPNPTQIEERKEEEDLIIQQRHIE